MEEKKRPNYLLIGIVVVVGVILLGAIIGAFRPSTSTLSGTVNFNGLSPEAGNEDQGEIVLMQKEIGESDFQKTDVKIPFRDQANWVWDQALEGTTYEVKVDVYYQGTFIKSSDTVTSTAPASGIVLTTNITLADIPDFIVKQQEATISGTIEINGHVPSGSTVKILQKKSDETEYVEATDAVIASDDATWRWESGEFGQDYHIKAQLLSGSTNIGESGPIKVTAPASNEVLKITSTAQAPVQKAVISGIVQLRGPVEQNSTILMLQKRQGDADYTEFQRMPAVNNAKWLWEEAVSGQSYEITAALQVKEANASTGNVVSATAPASDEVVIIDTSLSLEAPKDTPIVDCGSEDSAGGYNAKLSYMKVSDAKKYYMTVGTSSGGDDVSKELQDATDLNAELTVYVKKETSYFTRYAYSYCADCNINDTQNWSGWSPTLGFKCEQNAAVTL